MTDNENNTNASPQTPSRWWVLFPAGLAVLCVVLVFVVYHYRDQYYDLRDRYRSLHFRSAGLENDCRRYRKLLADFERPPLQVKPTMTSLELAILAKKGLDDPYVALADDLVTNPHLEDVPYGELDFTDTGQVCILSPERALARYEGLDDTGLALLSYRVDDRGSVSWRVLERFPEPQ